MSEGASRSSDENRSGATVAERQWFIVSRWQEFEAESRTNLLRILAVGLFYSVQLAQFHLWSVPDDAERSFHRSATLLSIAWLVFSLLVHICLYRRYFPPALKFLTTGFDVVMLTALLMAGEGPSSPLVVAYFLIIAAATLRLSLSLLWCATLGCMAGYLATIGVRDSKWFDADHVVPPVQQALMLLSLALTGIILGQVVRRVRQLALEFARRIQATQA